jgi:hypothetical protein
VTTHGGRRRLLFAPLRGWSFVRESV